MTIIEGILFFVIGTVFGSFYNVVGSRLPNGESIISPRSHCNNCKHELTPIELIPILSYIIQGGKCRKCHVKLSISYLIYEFISGLTFLLCYLRFGITLDIIIPLTFLSMLIIIVVSDFEYMIISDEVLIVFGLFLVIELIILNGWNSLAHSIISGVIAFVVMFGIKKIGDFLFKKESMGWGDIKLLFFFGLVLGWENALLSIFFGSLAGFPVSLLIMKLKKSNIIPFGPFLALGAAIIMLTGFDAAALLNMLVI